MIGIQEIDFETLSYSYDCLFVRFDAHRRSLFWTPHVGTNLYVVLRSHRGPD